MTAEQHAANRTIDDASIQKQLHALAGIHPWVVAVDAQRRVLWTSAAVAGLKDLRGAVPAVEVGGILSCQPPGTRAPRDDDAFQLRAAEDRRGALDLDSVRIQGEAGSVLVVIARPRRVGRVADDGLDARLLDASPDAALAVDADGFVRRANAAARRLLAGGESLTGRALTALLLQYVGSAEELADLFASGEELPRHVLRLRGTDGGWRSFSVRVAPLERGVRALFLRDASEDLHGAEELRRANDELEHCVNALAHDLRSPLVAMLGFSRLLRQDYRAVLDDTGEHYLDRIEQAARTMESLIHDLLELARIDEPVEQPALVDSRKVLVQISAEFKPRLDDHGISLELEADSYPMVRCDHSRLYQIFSNLIGNAIDHMGPCDDPRIVVRIEESARTHEIVVSDNGRGVPPEHRDRIFEVFQSLETRADGRRGTGMGLAIVKKIAAKHGGRVWLESEPGCGAHFHVSLPRR